MSTPLDMHLLPEGDDILVHRLSANCECNPDLHRQTDGSYLVLHNSIRFFLSAVQREDYTPTYRRQLAGGLRPTLPAVGDE